MASEQVRLAVTHSVLYGNQNFRNFALSLTIGQLKEKLQMFIGTEPQFQKLALKDKDGQIVAKIDDDASLLSSYAPKDGMELYVEDIDPKKTVAELTDISKAEKYVMSDEDYLKRENTYRKEKEKIVSSQFHIGERVEVASDDPAQTQSKKGTIMYLGSVEGAKGVWIGVKLDEPNGKNDGSAKGKRYFTCEPNYGLFVKPEKVIVLSNETGNGKQAEEPAPGKEEI